MNTLRIERIGFGTARDRKGRLNDGQCHTFASCVQPPVRATLVEKEVGARRDTAARELISQPKSL
jgi:hypothetical protein